MPAVAEPQQRRTVMATPEAVAPDEAVVQDGCRRDAVADDGRGQSHAMAHDGRCQAHAVASVQAQPVTTVQATAPAESAVAETQQASLLVLLLFRAVHRRAGQEEYTHLEYKSS